MPRRSARALSAAALLVAALVASLLPALPARPGSGTSVALAATICPPALHDTYTTTNPALFDNRTYPTWHPQKYTGGQGAQWDAYIGCYFGHEHGSNPALFQNWNDPAQPGWKGPPFGVASYHASMVEPHVGFKVYVVTNDGATPTAHAWMLVHHFGTASGNRTCVQNHEVQAYWRNAGDLSATGGKGAYAFMADFGQSFDNTGAILYQPDGSAGGPTCTQTVTTFASRFVPRYDLSQFGYEPWKFDHSHAPSLSLASFFTPNTRDPQTLCTSVACQNNQLLYASHFDAGCACYLQNSGATRFLTVGASSTDRFGTTPGPVATAGKFCTNSAASTTRHNGACVLADGTDAITQFSDPAYGPSTWGPFDPVTQKYVMQVYDGAFVVVGFSDAELENSLDNMVQIPN